METTTTDTERECKKQGGGCGRTLPIDKFKGRGGYVRNCDECRAAAAAKKKEDAAKLLAALPTPRPVTEVTGVKPVTEVKADTMSVVTQSSLARSEDIDDDAELDVDEEAMHAMLDKALIEMRAYVRTKIKKKTKQCKYKAVNSKIEQTLEEL